MKLPVLFRRLWLVCSGICDFLLPNCRLLRFRQTRGTTERRAGDDRETTDSKIARFAPEKCTIFKIQVNGKHTN